MFVAVAQLPSVPDAVSRAAAAAGLAPADAARFLAGTLPRVLVRATDNGEGLVQALEQQGFRAFAADLARVPTGKDRVVARDLEWIPEGFVVLDGRGERHPCPAAAVGLIQQGVIRTETSEEIKTTERRLAVGKAIMSGGLMLTKKVEKTSVKHELDKEPFVLVQRRDGRPDILFQERRMNYACLGDRIQPNAFGNLVTLLACLRQLAPGAAFDDRVGRPGFLTGLPLMAGDPLDLALYLVAQAVAMGC